MQSPSTTKFVRHAGHHPLRFPFTPDSRLAMIALLCLLALPSPPAHAQMRVTDDAFTSAASPSRNFGAQTILAVQDTGSNSYLKFDISVLPASLSSADISKASLRLYLDADTAKHGQGGLQGSFDVYLVNGPWTESTLTAANAPSLGALILSGAQLPSQTQEYVEIDVTAAVQAWLSGTANNGLALLPTPGSTLSVSFDSKENTQTSHDPELNLVLANSTPAALSAEVARAQAAENTITANLNNEITRAQAAESSISSNLATETAARTAGDADTLAASKRYTDTSVAAETTRAQGAETSIAVNLSNEIGRAQSAENTIAANLNNEVTRAQAAESSISSGLAAETTARTAGDAGTLAASKSYTDAGVAAETTRAQGAELTITANLNNEIAARQAAESGFAQLAQANVFTGDQAVNGNVRVNGAGNGVIFADGSLQTTAAANSNIPNNSICSLEIVGSTPTPPPGYLLLGTLTAGLNAWASQAPMPTARGLLAVVELNGKFYAIGGRIGVATNLVEVYDPASDTWTTGTAMPAKRELLAAVALNGKIYAIGGEGTAAPNTMDVYDLASDSWSPGTPLPAPLLGPAAAVLNGKIYVLGGEVPDTNNTLNTVYMYDPASTTWTAVAPMNTPRAFPAAATLNGKLYALGGFTLIGSNIQTLNSVEVYDPVSNSWSPAPAMPTARQALAAAVSGGKIFALGGTTDFLRPMPTAEIFDPNTNAWTATAPMPTARTGPGAVTAHGLVYAIGGIGLDTFGIRINATEKYLQTFLYTFIKQP
jgi:N-acetylneuraminic acid mutarotase